MDQMKLDQKLEDHFGQKPLHILLKSIVKKENLQKPSFIYPMGKHNDSLRRSCEIGWSIAPSNMTNP